MRNSPLLTCWFCGLLFCGWVNREIAAEPFTTSRDQDHHDLSYYVSHERKRVPIRTRGDWLRRRQQIVAGIEEAMGPFPRPETPLPLNVETLEEVREESYIRRKVAYHTDAADHRVHAWLLLPTDEPARRRAAVLCLHPTTPAGKDSSVGLAGRPSLHYGLELVKRGYITLSPDYPSFGEYRHDFATDDYQSGSMKAIYDNVRAIDLLTSLPEVDPKRIGCIGHSLGGHHGLFTAVFDERIRAIVSSCGFTRFHKYKGGNLRGWSGPVYMPRVASEYGLSPDRMPFDFAEVIAALAPRGVLIVAPVGDDNFAVEGVREVMKSSRPVYELLDAAKRLRAVYPNDGHDFLERERSRAYAFLDEILEFAP